MLSGLRLYGALGIAAALAIFIGFALHWKHQAAARGEKLATICATTREAAANPKLACGQVGVQISEMGKSIADLKIGIAHQNAAVDAMAKESDRQKAAAAEAVKRASTRAHEAEAASERLAVSSRSTVPPSASCKPSKALEEQWR